MEASFFSLRSSKVVDEASWFLQSNKKEKNRLVRRKAAAFLSATVAAPQRSFKTRTRSHYWWHTVVSVTFPDQQWLADFGMERRKLLLLCGETVTAPLARNNVVMLSIKWPTKSKNESFFFHHVHWATKSLCCYFHCPHVLQLACARPIALVALIWTKDHNLSPRSWEMLSAFPKPPAAGGPTQSAFRLFQRHQQSEHENHLKWPCGNRNVVSSLFILLMTHQTKHWLGKLYPLTSLFMFPWRKRDFECTTIK